MAAQDIRRDVIAWVKDEIGKQCQGELFHLAQLGAPRPKEADVRREVASGISQLRELARSKVSGANGRAAQAVPG